MTEQLTIYMFDLETRLMSTLKIIYMFDLGTIKTTDLTRICNAKFKNQN